MKNFEKFIEVFGQKKYEEFLNMAQDNAPVLRWFLDDTEEPTKEIRLPLPVKVEKVDKNKREINGINYDWYKEEIEDFYLSGERTKEFRIKDDKSSSNNKVKSVSGLKHRFVVCLGKTGLEESVVVRHYYQNSSNECVVLENLEAMKSSAITYKYC